MKKRNYEDIIYLPHYEPKNHPRMPIYKRAAQFAPFAALTGYGEMVEEAGRYVEKRPGRSEEESRMIEEKIRILIAASGQKPDLRIHYFQKDRRKAGGSGRWKAGSLKKADPYREQMVMDDGTIIPFQDILAIEGDIFRETFFDGD